MANPETKESSDLFEKVFHKNTTHRVFDVTVLILLLCLLLCRLLSFKYHGFAFAWFLAFLCESCFTFIWILIVNCKWTLLTYKTYPQVSKKGNKLNNVSINNIRIICNCLCHFASYYTHTHTHMCTTQQDTGAAPSGHVCDNC